MYYTLVPPSTEGFSLHGPIFFPQKVFFRPCREVSFEQTTSALVQQIKTMQRDSPLKSASRNDVPRNQATEDKVSDAR